MNSPYKRRRPSMIRNLWVYRQLIGVAFALGVLLWFIVINDDPVEVTFPFRLGSFESTAGLAVLLGAVVGSLLTMTAGGIVFAVRRLKVRPRASDDDREPDFRDDDLPPTDYAAKAPEGFQGGSWPGPG